MMAMKCSCPSLTLGHEHALLALSPLCLCQHCKTLSMECRQRRADTAAAIAEGPGDFTVPLDDALSLLANSESDDSDRGEEGASPPACPLRMEGSEPFATNSLPVVGALVAELPGIIARAAANLGLAVPMPQAPQRPDQLHGIWGIEAATRPARPDPIWPMFPAIRPYFSRAAAEPGKLGAPSKTFIQVTKTEGVTGPHQTYRGYRAVPRLNPALCAVFGVKPGLSGRRSTPKDQLTAKLTDRAHQCMMQQEAVMKNIAPLPHERGSLP
ncbi:unnamed protein product [Boreogadus saida]